MSADVRADVRVDVRAGVRAGTGAGVGAPVKAIYKHQMEAAPNLVLTTPRKALHSFIPTS